MAQAEPDREPTFEEALAQIERIVVGLERGEIDLAQALTRYEQGMKLLAHCRGLIDQADQAVKLLTAVDPQGHPVTAPFENKATYTPPAAASTQAPTGGGVKKVTPRPRKVGADPQGAGGDDESVPF